MGYKKLVKDWNMPIIAKYKKSDSNENKRKRAELVYSALEHIKSLKVGLQRFKGGSSVESPYIREHFERLKYYIDEITKYTPFWGYY